jgi:hypothetical protein
MPERGGVNRWLDAGSFALGVLTEALAHLRAPAPSAPPVAAGVGSSPVAPVAIDSKRLERGRARPGSRPRRPAVRRPRTRPEP